MKLATLSVAALLCGCAAAPTLQTQPGEFKLAVSGNVAPGAHQAAVDCIMDGLDAASPMMANTSVRQQRRVSGYRIDRFAGAVVLLTIDVTAAGRVELHESSAAGLISTRDDHAAVTACIEKHKG